MSLVGRRSVGATNFVPHPASATATRDIVYDHAGNLTYRTNNTYAGNDAVDNVDPFGLQDGMANPANAAALEEAEAAAEGYPNVEAYRAAKAAQQAAEAAQKAEDTMAKQLAKVGPKSVQKACKSFAEQDCETRKEDSR